MTSFLGPVFINMSGGSQPSATTDTRTLTANRASSFEVSHVFDLGGPTAFYAKCTATTLTGDGETWVASSGGIVFGDAFLGGPVQVSFDGSTWLDAASSLWKDIAIANDIVAVLAFHDGYGVTPRYVKVGFAVEDWNSGTPYTGANNPVAVGDVEVRALVLT